MRQDNGPWGACDPVRRQHGGRGRSGGWGGGFSGPWGGPPPWLGELLGQPWGAGSGPGAPWGRRHAGGPQRPRARRGDVRTAILDVLAGSPEPVNGYQVIQQIAERSHGLWKPSPGSVYPTIAQLQDEELVEDAPSGRKALRLTDEGRRHVERHAEGIAAMWASFDDAVEPGDDEPTDLKQVIGQTVGAIIQVVTNGTPDQRDRAVEILADTRRRLYGILADGPRDAEEDDESRGND